MPAPEEVPNKQPDSKLKLDKGKELSLRHPTWTYLHLHLDVAPPSTEAEARQQQQQPDIDEMSLRKHLHSALQQFLGLSGTAIPIDVLKAEGANFWIRVPAGDGRAVAAAAGGWVGSQQGRAVSWTLRAWDDHLVKIVAGDGQDLFR